jgi:hypothetical protein
MYAQLRIYTVNSGRMDDWVEWFNDKLRPIAELAGHTILGPWVNEAKTEFVWIRTYDSASDAEAKDGVFYGSREWKAVGPDAREFLAKIEVTIMSSPLPPRDE